MAGEFPEVPAPPEAGELQSRSGDGLADRESKQLIGIKLISNRRWGLGSAADFSGAQEPVDQETYFHKSIKHQVDHMIKKYVNSGS